MDDEVEFRFRPSSYLFPRGLFFLVLAALFVPATQGAGASTVVVYSLILLTQLAIPVIQIVSAVRHPVAFRFSTEGVTWPPTGYHRAWSEFTAVRVTRRRTWWHPGLLLIDRREVDFARRAGTRPSGAALDVRHVRASRVEILAAIRRFAELEVIQD